MSDSRAIGIFDSGLGGLTVLKTLASDFPEESFLYLGDVARLPYGNKSPETIRKYGEQILRFLVQRDVKMLIIACNTASTVFLEENSFNGLPLFNVISPGSSAAIESTKNKKIGVIATSTTVKGHAYKKTLQKMDASVEVLEVACPLFVPLAEEGMVNDEVTQLMANRYLKNLMAEKIDTLVLGCTHYPILKDDIAKVTGPGIELIESGKVLAKIIKSHFESTKTGAPQNNSAHINICATDVTVQFEEFAQKMMAPRKVGELERVVL